MHVKFGLMVLAALAVSSLAVTQDTAAQANPAHNHIGHVADGFRGTPDGVGLLDAAIAEAGVAAQHAGFAARDPSNLDAMKRHMGHVLHALSPEEVENGPGAGYGVVAAAGGVARHIDLAASSDGASDAVKTHANHVSTAAQNTVERATQMIELAKSIQDASSASDAAGMVSQLAELGAQLTAGAGSGWQEGGLDACQTHLGLIKSAEGLGN
ncbi:MAG TPA: hypothetical protein EYN99_00690 [Gemmatimonadetes bacterium]|nr:hypothetical protein [Gemmatimonadota bacterium]